MWYGILNYFNMTYGNVKQDYERLATSMETSSLGYTIHLRVKGNHQYIMLSSVDSNHPDIMLQYFFRRYCPHSR